MDIMAGYGIRHRKERIFTFYWENLSIVEQEGCYCRDMFKGHQGDTQGYTLFSAIFNMVADTVICHWFTLVAGEESGPEGFVRAVQWLAEFIYTISRILASP